MKDPYTSSAHRPNDNSDNQKSEKAACSDEPAKSPSEESVRKVLDFSKAYEVHHRSDGAVPIDLIRN